MQLSRVEQERQFKLGYALAFTKKAKKKPWKEIFAIWENPAINGHTRSQFNLGTCYDFGQGVERDTSMALEWYLKAANKGHKLAQYNIGFFFKGGKEVEQDYKKAVHWFTLSAEQGDPDA